MRFQYSFDFKNFTEKIRYWYATDIYEIEDLYDSDQHEIVEPLFNTISNLLSVNYKCLIDKIFNYLVVNDSYSEDEIFTILNSASFLLTEAPIIKEIMLLLEEYSVYIKADAIDDFKQDFFNDVYYQCFYKFDLLNFYIKEYRGDPLLDNPDNFAYFALSATNTAVSTLNDEVEELNDYAELIDLDHYDKKMIMRYLERSIKPELNIITRYDDGALSFYATCIYQIIKHGFAVNKCKNCNKYFVAFNRSDTLYCDRISPQDSSKTCKEYGKYINYLNKNKNDKATKMYKQIYNILGNKYRRTKTSACKNGNPRMKKNLVEFTSVANEWKEKIKSGERTEAEFIKWLQERKESAINGDNSETGE